MLEYLPPKVISQSRDISDPHMWSGVAWRLDLCMQNNFLADDTMYTVSTKINISFVARHKQKNTLSWLNITVITKHRPHKQMNVPCSTHVLGRGNLRAVKKGKLKLVFCARSAAKTQKNPLKRLLRTLNEATERYCALLSFSKWF